MHLNDILCFVQREMEENKKSLKGDIAASIPNMKSYYQGRYDAYYAIVDSLKAEVKRLRLTY